MQDYILMEVDRAKEELVKQGYEVVIKQNSFSDTKDVMLVTNVVIDKNTATLVVSNFKL